MCNQCGFCHCKQYILDKPSLTAPILSTRCWSTCLTRQPNYPSHLKKRQRQRQGIDITFHIMLKMFGCVLCIMHESSQNIRLAFAPLPHALFVRCLLLQVFQALLALVIDKEPEICAEILAIRLRDIVEGDGIALRRSFALPSY